MPSLPWHPFHPFILVGRLFFSKPHRYLLFIYFTFIITHAFFCGVCQRSLWLPNVPGAGPTVSNPLPPPTLLFTAGICDGTSFISNLYFFFPSPFPVHRRILLHFAGRCRAALGCRSSLMNQREGFVSPGSPREAMLYAPNHPRCFISFPSLLYIFTLISYSGGTSLIHLLIQNQHNRN